MHIQIKSLSKFYGKGKGRQQVLRDITLSIAGGEFVSIVGTSGSGKTTLLNIMGGLDRGFEGQVEVGHHSFAELSDRALAGLRNEHFGFVFQQFNLLDHLNAAENIALPSFFARGRNAGAKFDSTSPKNTMPGTSPAHENTTPGTVTTRQNGFSDHPLERAKSLFEKVGLGDKFAERPPQLSGGQKQRVAIARALFHQPSIIFCDEPTGSLDRRTGLQIMRIFQTLNREEGRTLIIVTHEEHIARMASRIVRLEDGALVADEANTPVIPAEEDLYDALARGETERA